MKAAKVLTIAIVWLPIMGHAYIVGHISTEAMLLAFLVADMLLRRAGHP